jgi:enoyl-CoA hydratase/carnithine racemase
MAVTQEREGRVLVVRIDRPQKRNAVDVETALGIDAALNRLEDDPDLRVGILTGSADVFSAGTDLVDGFDARTERGGEYGVIRRRRTKPLVAAVEGIAFGGGLEIALACDVVVAARTARFALPETRRGLVASSGALFRAMRALPLPVVKDLLLTGAEIDGERAHTLGLVSRLSEAGGALDGARAVAAEICLSSPLAVATTLEALAGQLAADEELGWQVTAAAWAAVEDSADRDEGVAAFLDRRPPRWTLP